jgi:hypothetical protein
MRLIISVLLIALEFQSIDLIFIWNSLQWQLRVNWKEFKENMERYTVAYFIVMCGNKYKGTLGRFTDSDFIPGGGVSRQYFC